MFTYGHGVGRWLGRWLCCWLGVLAAGCSTRSMLPVATLVPLATMPDYTRTPPTRTPVWRIRITPTRNVVLTVSTSPTRSTLLGPLNTPVTLQLAPPTCYETPVGSFWCLGLIRNPLSVAVTSVQIRVTLVTTDGLAVSTQEISSTRQWIPSGDTATYGALFFTSAIGPVGSFAEVIQAEPVQTGTTIAVPLVAHNLHGELADKHYHIQAVIDNSTTQTVQLSIVITLLDADGRVTGFRQLDTISQFQPGASLPLDVDGIALAAGATHFIIDADGLLLKTS